MVDENTPRTPFIENVQRKEASRPAIIVQEELKRIYVRISNSSEAKLREIDLFDFFPDLDEPLAFEKRSI